MPSHDETSTDATEAPRSLGSRLERVAVTVDGWFVGCVASVGAFGKRATRAVDGVVSSTASFARAESLGRVRAWVARSERGGVEGGDGERFALLSAVVADDVAGIARAPIRELEDAARTNAQEPAGLVPLMRALAAVVNAHAPDGYRALAGDARFWPLIELIASFRVESEPPANRSFRQGEEDGPCTHSG